MLYTAAPCRHADIVEEEVGLTFLNPTYTRRCSSYTAVERVVTVVLIHGLLFLPISTIESGVSYRVVTHSPIRAWLVHV